MPSTWFALITLMLTTYVVLDGFDFGVGMLHLFVARSDEERRTLLAAIGPVWNGNEVWLVASGGVLVFAFPRVYAVAFSGLYLPLILVLWLFVARGVAIEFRSQVENPLWRAFWDVAFAGASFALALVFGVALGNVLRGVPIDHTGWFAEDLFPGFHSGIRPAAIDLYTSLVGLFAVATLAAHGATFLHWKTGGALGERCRLLARRLWIAAVSLGGLVTATTAVFHVEYFERFLARPWLWGLPVFALAGLVFALRSLARRRELPAFLGSIAFIASLLLATAGTLFPTILRSTVDESFSLDAYNAASAHAGLVVGLLWWVPALLLAVAYFTYLFRTIAGKADPDHGNY